MPVLPYAGKYCPYLNPWIGMPAGIGAPSFQSSSNHVLVFTSEVPMTGHPHTSVLITELAGVSDGGLAGDLEDWARLIAVATY